MSCSMYLLCKKNSTKIPSQTPQTIVPKHKHSIAMESYNMLVFITCFILLGSSCTCGDTVPPAVPDAQDTRPPAQTSHQQPTPPAAPTTTITTPDSREERSIDQTKNENMFNHLISIKNREGEAILKTKPEKGSEANALLNPREITISAKRKPPTMIRPAIGQGTTDEEHKKEQEDTRKSYLPLYACDDDNSYPMALEPLYRGCMHGCQMKEPVKVTILRLQSPKPYKSTIEVTWLSAVQMYDACHEDIWGRGHRIKSAVEYPLSDNEIQKILDEVADHLIIGQDLIHGNYPKAECSYWQDTKESSVITRIRKSNLELFYGPEVDDYYIHLPMDQVNVLMWDKQYDGVSGSYRWKYRNLDRPCLLKTGEEITCLGSLKSGENLQCATAGVVLEAPYVTAWDKGCKQMTTKDSRGSHFYLVKETTMSYKDAIRDSNPNVQSLGNAMTHIEELLCMAGCNELTLMTISNNTDLVVDTPVGIWKRKTGSGSIAVQCSAMSTGKIELLTPICTILGVVGIKHIGSSGTTYHWDMTQLYASTTRHTCLTETITDLAPLLRHQENGTFIMDTFAGRVELNTQTGESRFLYYNEQMTINKQRWFPNVLLEQQSPETATDTLEIAIMQQLRNLSAEYQASCAETKGPVVLQTVGGTVWMLEKDINDYWSGLVSYFWIWKIALSIVIIWMVFYMVLLFFGAVRTVFIAKRMVQVPVNYKRARRNPE
nr:glycoprotein [Strawberry virus 3]